MRIAVPVEQQPGEARVALTPDSVKRLAGSGIEIVVEKGAGAGAGFLDDEYRSAGATIADRGATLSGAQVLACVNRPELRDFDKLKVGTVVIGFLKPLDEPAALEP